VASWAVVADVPEIGAAVRADEPTGTRALLVLGGLVSAAFGVSLFARPGMGAFTLAYPGAAVRPVQPGLRVRTIVHGIELVRTRTALVSALRVRPRREPGLGDDDTAVAERHRRVLVPISHTGTTASSQHHRWPATALFAFLT